MKVHELIEWLKEYPQNAHILVDGYEDGLDNIKTIRQVYVKDYEDKEDYYGDYEVAKPDDEEIHFAVTLSRYEQR